MDGVKSGLCGGVAGATTAFVFYGADSYKILKQAGISFRSIVQNHSDVLTVNTLRKNAMVNFRHLLKGGVPISIFGSGIGYGVFFGIYDPLKDWLSARFDQKYSFAAIPLAATLSAIPSTLLSVPADVIKKQILVGDNKTVSVIHATKNVIQSKGIQGLFIGWKANILIEVPLAGVELTIYEMLSSIYLSFLNKFHKPWKSKDKVSQSIYLTASDQLTPFQCAQVGFLTGVASAIITNPIDCINTRMKSGELSHLSLTRAHLYVIETNGYKALFRGLLPRIAIASCGSTCFWYFYAKMKHFVI